MRKWLVEEETKCLSFDMKDSVLVLSGGMDSTTLLHDRKEQIALAVTFDYGSRHNAREIECARKNCMMLV